MKKADIEKRLADALTTLENMQKKPVGERVSISRDAMIKYCEATIRICTALLVFGEADIRDIPSEVLESYTEKFDEALARATPEEGIVMASVFIPKQSVDTIFGCTFCAEHASKVAAVLVDRLVERYFASGYFDEEEKKLALEQADEKGGNKDGPPSNKM